MGRYAHQPFPYQPPAELRGAAAHIRPVAIVGAGPVGLTAAIDLAMHGVRCVVLDDNDVVSVGSRAICWAKRTLEIFDRLGVAERMVAKGVTWQIGRVYHRDREIYSFDLLPEHGHKMPAFINLQQYYVEEYLIARCADFPNLVELRWRNRVRNVRQREQSAVLQIDAPDGSYELEARWVIAADGARSTVRESLGLSFEGRTFEEKFLIADIQMQASCPSDRRFWFQPEFDAGESALMHRQPDDSFRIDFQLGWQADSEVERQPERVAERVRRVVGRETPFSLDWWSVYTFRCARIERFVHGRIVFAGDSAHLVSPFGARGGNGGIQDADNLCWKLAYVLQGKAPAALIESYNEERMHGCEENIRDASRTTQFMTPKTPIERMLRDAVLRLARSFPFARSLTNAGRLSRPCSLAGLTMTPNENRGVAGPMVPGAPCADAPINCLDARKRWLLERLGGDFTVLTFASSASELERCRAQLLGAGVELSLLLALPDGSAPLSEELLIDCEGYLLQRYGGVPGVTYLIRPDQHVAARFTQFDVHALKAAHARATARSH